MPGKISGYFLSFSDGELQLVETALREMGYDTGPTGLKEYLLDSIMDPQPARKEETRLRDETLAMQIGKFLKDHPETVGVYATLGLSSLKNLADRITDNIKKARAT
jgi:hypothetical protein